MINNSEFVDRVVQKIVDLAYQIVEWDQRDKRDTRTGRFAQDPRNEQVLGAGEHEVDIVDVTRYQSKEKGDPNVIISVKMENGEIIKKFFTINKKAAFYIRRDFLWPLGHSEFQDETPLQDYIDFDFESYKGKRMKVETKFSNKGILEITNFKEELPW